MNHLLLRLVFVSLLGGIATTSLAQDLGSFEINKTRNQSPYQVALVPFAGDPLVAEIINTNLNQAALATTSQNLPHRPTTVADFAANRLLWVQAGIPYVVIGQLTPNNNKTTIHFDVIETATGRVMGGHQTQLADNTTSGLRHASHVVSDRIYELITGEMGDFSGRIAYVEETGDPKNKTSTLKLMDADGQNERVLFSVQGSIFSPTWSKDGRTLAYAVQRPNGLPVIYTQNADGGGQQLVTPFKGNNLGPSFSPDGTTLLFSGSHENNDPAIYELHLASGQTKKLTNLSGAENSPRFAPDGRSFFFTADMGSRTPKLYRYDINSGKTTLLVGGMISGPSVSPDGKKLAYVSGSTLVVNDNGSTQAIGQTNIHESASFSPNSHRIVYATPQGLVFRHLRTGTTFHKPTQGRVREPAWSANR